ncbi:uncharacterized protein r-cup [Drosophila pseudoobscura]|uniref:Uncharacterized protein r-cup n=1 Tax=Drosophila pseudoobscura pseudoobscura TaxID=46245 RepID=A0A6I8UGB6_DROPS|nr:uncharacterized protein LOC4814621 [Drosophila pseudoobscura]
MKNPVTIKMEAAVAAPAGKLLEQVKPWEVFDWPEEQRRNIHRSWGSVFANARMNSAAQKYFDKCIEDHHGHDCRTLQLRSKFSRSVARPEAALEDSTRAAKVLGPGDVHSQREMADALYDLNRFESNKMLLSDNVRRHVGTFVEPFEKRLIVVNENFKDSMGHTLGNFFMENSSSLGSFYERKRRELLPPDKRPHWKILRESNQCDVQSVQEEEKENLSPLEHARRSRKTKIFYQNYLNRAWTDFIFLKTLRQNPNLLLDHYFGTSEERRKYLDNSFQRIKTFTRMLHSRSPMYNEMRRGHNLSQRFREENLFRIQYQTHRNMHSILRTIRVLKQHDDPDRLRKFVEDVMANYVTVKTSRVMPWKVEFTNEVYNHLALSLCESYRLPTTRVTPYDKNSMCLMLNIQAIKPLERTVYVFGDRSSYSYPLHDKPKSPLNLQHLEQRLYFAKLPIERTYLLHEMADYHVQQNHFVQCLSYAQQAIEESKLCNSKIWQFLSTMLMAKSHAVLHKYERQTEVLNDAYMLAAELQNPRLCTFVELCRMLNKDYITLRKMSQLVASKRVRSRQDNRSSVVSSPQISSTNLSLSHPTEHENKDSRDSHRNTLSSVDPGAQKPGSDLFSVTGI